MEDSAALNVPTLLARHAVRSPALCAGCRRGRRRAQSVPPRVARSERPRTGCADALVGLPGVFPARQRSPTAANPCFRLDASLRPVCRQPRSAAPGLWHDRLVTNDEPLAAVRAADVPAERRSAPRYSFSGHQTFPFRHAWLPKGVAAVREDAGVFGSPDALVRLRVGRNMVASIRHWGEALGVFETRRGRSRLTPLGVFLFCDSDAGAADLVVSSATPPPPDMSGRTQHRGGPEATRRQLPAFSSDVN